MDKTLFNLIKAFGLAIIFIVMGFYLIQKEDRLAKIIGYANIIFWSGLLLLAFGKLIYDNYKKNKNAA
ncbi:hypothetical protein [Flavobacterium pallidum]|uniref:Uncharacterized protein n=1 Tax=Flavobacterium pallidum TaxID=2172098 RepID=A0A2S1SJ52_9FLAO|nr:hypothetical protein [Flavobacterium pallidum]AWI26454.1 hypothetical protein HYN49_11375 [Flavobacterium pallidum]